MDQVWAPPFQGQRSRIRLTSPNLLSFVLELALALIVIGSLHSTARPRVPVERYVIPLASLSPSEGLNAPVNFGYRCTVVDAAAVLNYYGISIPQDSLALRLSSLAEYSDQEHGIPWWAYVSWPGQRPLLDQAIERTSRDAGHPVLAETVLGLNFDRAARAIAVGHPVILNVYRTPDGTPNHSLLAYGFNTRAGSAQLYAIDPNSQQSYWIGSNSLWSWTVTSTYIRPAGTDA
jgi:Peptidase_C39 like family